MITKRDKEIVKYVEKNGSITSKICSKQFFRGNKEAYDQARKRLRVIHEEGLLKRYRKDPRSEAVYYIDKKLKIHDLKLLDVISDLNELDIVMFDKEKQIETDEYTKYIVDGAVVIEKNNIRLPLLIEIDYTHYTNLEKIRDIINYLENKHSMGYHFVVVKFSQEEIKVHKIGKYSKLFILPWNLNKFSEVITSLRSDIERLEVLNNQ